MRILASRLSKSPWMSMKRVVALTSHPCSSFTLWGRREMTVAVDSLFTDLTCSGLNPNTDLAMFKSLVAATCLRMLKTNFSRTLTWK